MKIMFCSNAPSFLPMCRTPCPCQSCSRRIVNAGMSHCACSNLGLPPPARRTRPLPRIAVPVWIYHVCQPSSVFCIAYPNSPCTKLPSTLLPVCSSGCPTTICRNRCSPSRRCSITSSLKRLVNTFPGRGGMVTRADSRSRMSRKYSKSL
jgi:hypothetical protein